MVFFRKEKLQEAHQLQLFKANQRLLLEWSLKQSSEMAEKGLPKTRTEADRLIVEHQDWRVSTVAYLNFTTLMKYMPILNVAVFRRRLTLVLNASTLSGTLVWVSSGLVTALSQRSKRL